MVVEPLLCDGVGWWWCSRVMVARLDVVVTLIVVGCIRCFAMLPRTGFFVALAFCSDGGDGIECS